MHFAEGSKLAKFIEIESRLIDLESGQVHHGGEVAQLSPRLLSLLNHFVAHSSQVLSRDDLIESVWGHLEAATDDSVNVAVSSLRRFIGDDRRPHRILKAIPRRGYLFESGAWRALDDGQAKAAISASHAPAEPSKAPVAQPQGNSTESSPTKSSRPGLWAALILIAAVAALLWYQPWDRGLNDPGENFANQSVAQSPAPAPASSIGKSVAVLPFLDASTDGNQGPFADGLVDRIIHMLTLSPDLEVVARTSSFAFRDSSASIAEIGEKLQVDAILEGSVQHSQDTVRVVAQLIDAQTEKHIWSRTYDRAAGELFSLQDEIANEVAQTMTNSLLPGSDLPHADSQRVWELITQGRFATDRATLDSTGQAVSYFEQALELQPDNVEALIGMVDALNIQRSLGPSRATGDNFDITEEYLERARSLAPDSALVSRAVGDWHFNHARADEAITAYRRAISLNPNDAAAYRNLGRVLFREDRYDDAIEPLRTAVRLDPFSGMANVWLADAFWAVGRAEEALFRLRGIIEDKPDFPQAHDRIATYLAQSGETGQAMWHIVRARELDPDSARRWFRVCEFWLHLGADDQAEQCTDALLAEHDMPFLGLYLRQIIHGFRGEWEATRDILASIYEQDRPDPLTRALLAQAWSRTDCPRALDVLHESFPGLFQNPPEVSPTLLLAAKTAIYCMQQTGAGEEAMPLLEEFSDWVERTRNERGPWLVAGFEPAWVYSLKGDYDAALTVLEDLVDDDWRYYWWGLDAYPEFGPMLDNPRFHAMQQRLEEGVRAQRELFESLMASG